MGEIYPSDGRSCGHTGITEDDWGSRGSQGIGKADHGRGDVPQRI